MVQINLLPWREKAKQEKKERLAITLSFFIILTLLFILILHLHINSLIATQQQRNDFLQSELMKEQAVLDDLNQKKQQQTAMDKQLLFIFGLRDKSYQAVRLLNELISVVPDAVSLNKLIRQDNSIVILGKAESNLQITLFMKNIEKAHVFKQPVLTEITGKENTSGDERYFQLRVEQ